MLRPRVLHLRPHQLPVSTQASHRYYFSGSTKFNPPLSVLEFYGVLRTTENGKCLDDLVVSHEEPGATDHGSVEWDVLFDRILSTIRTESKIPFIF